MNLRIFGEVSACSKGEAKGIRGFGCVLGDFCDRTSRNVVVIVNDLIGDVEVLIFGKVKYIVEDRVVEADIKDHRNLLAVNTDLDRI